MPAALQVLEALGELDAHVDKLQGSIDPLSRMVQRLPGSSPRD